MATLLAIETSSVYCSAALLHEDRWYARQLHAGQTHSGQILQLVEEVLSEAGITLEDCDAIAFGAGPGSFTGLRIACSVTQGLAYGVDVPVLPVSTLTAMAEQLRSRLPDAIVEGSTVLCALDARMEEIYWSLLVWRGQEWLELVPPSLDSPHDLPLHWSGISKCDFACGNALQIYQKELSALVETISQVEMPDALGVANVALRALGRGEGLMAHEALPLYVRDRVALTTLERAEEKEQAAQDAALSKALSPSVLAA